MFVGNFREERRLTQSRDSADYRFPQARNRGCQAALRKPAPPVGNFEHPWCRGAKSRCNKGATDPVVCFRRQFRADCTIQSGHPSHPSPSLHVGSQSCWPDAHFTASLRRSLKRIIFFFILLFYPLLWPWQCDADPFQSCCRVNRRDCPFSRQLPQDPFSIWG